MAQNLVVNFIGNNKLGKTTAAATAQLKKFKSAVDSVGNSLNKTMGLGALTTFAGVTKVLKDSARAAAQDAKSRDQLAMSLRNSLRLTKDGTDAAENWVQSTSNAVAVLDDDLRPALEIAARATGSLSKGQRLVNLALDVSAGTGKDLVTVTKSLTKAQNGNLMGLNKLGTGIKFTANWFEQLTTSYQGMAQNAANADPFRRLNVIFDNMKETIGYELIPYINQFADLLKSPEGQKALKDIAMAFVRIGTTLAQAIMFIVRNIDLIKLLIAEYVYAKFAIFAMTTAMRIYTVATTAAAAATKTLKWALVSTGVGALVVAVASLASMWGEATDNQQEYYDQGIQQSPEFMAALESLGDATVEVDEKLGRIWRDGVLIFDQAAWDQKVADAKNAIQNAKDALVKTAEKFRDSVGLALGTSGKDEYSVFNIDVVIEKLKRMVNAAKGFGANLKALVKAGAGTDVINEIISMGPAQGNIVAKGLLQSGRLSEYLGLRGSLYGTGYGAQTVANASSNKTYQIEVNERNMTAEAIIKAIQAFEKKTGRKYFVKNG